MSIFPSKTVRAKRYSIDVEGIIKSSHLGAIDPESETRYVWNADTAVEFLAELQAQPGFDAERYCLRCEEYDLELAITAEQKRLPRLRPEKLRLLKLNPVSLPWEPGRPSQDAHLTERHKARPPRPLQFDACHGCLVSFLDEQELPEVPAEQVAALKTAFAQAKAEVSRLHQSRARETRPNVLEYAEQLLGRANARLRIAANACRDAGFEPFKPRSRRDGDEGPDQVVATEWDAEEASS